MIRCSSVIAHATTCGFQMHWTFAVRLRKAQRETGSPSGLVEVIESSEEIRREAPADVLFDLASRLRTLLVEPLLGRPPERHLDVESGIFRHLVVTSMEKINRVVKAVVVGLSDLSRHDNDIGRRGEFRRVGDQPPLG